ncbi:MAG: hypothetical protein R6W79_00285 [Acidimicrobiia bacterium]
MSVGHVARAVEEAGIPTVVVMVRAFRHVAEAMTIPRTVTTRHPMGRPLGAVNDAECQRSVLDAALSLVETATRPGTIIDLEAPFTPGTLGRS